MALDTSHPRVRRILIGRVLRGHYAVASGSAETHRVHILHATVGGGPNDKEIEHCSHDYPFQSTPDHRQLQVNGRINLRQLPSPKQTSSLEPDAQGNQQQPQHEDAGKNQKDQKANVRMRWSRKKNVIEPESDSGKRRTGRDYGTRKCDGILSQKIDRLRPVPDAFSQFHVKWLLLSIFPAPSGRHTSSSAAQTPLPRPIALHLDAPRTTFSACGYRPPAP